MNRDPKDLRGQKVIRVYLDLWDFQDQRVSKVYPDLQDRWDLKA